MQTITNVIEVATVYLANSASGPPEVASMRALPNPGAAWDAPRTAANQAPVFGYGYIRGSITKNVSFACPYSEKAPANFIASLTKF